MSQTIGMKKGYSSHKVSRRVNQQGPHHFIHHKYQVIGTLEDVEDPDVVITVADAYRAMRLTKAYTWKTGELANGLSGAAWCTNSFPIAFENKTMTYNIGDKQSRCLMNLAPGEVYCTIHYDLLPMIVENIQTGIAM